MSDGEFIESIKNLYASFFETSIGKEKEGHPQFGSMTDNAFINLQHNAMMRYIKRRSPTFDFGELSDYQLSEYKHALIMQLKYVLSEGDVRLLSGYDLTTNSMINKEELEKRAISPMAIDTLKACGLLYRGIQPYAGYSPYPRGWR